MGPPRVWRSVALAQRDQLNRARRVIEDIVPTTPRGKRFSG
jgi:hypothetical protein